MNYCQGQYPLIQKDNLAKNIYSFTILCPEIAEKALCGQFVHVKANGFLLRRPISLCEIDRAAGTIRIVFEIRGEGTRAIADLRQGDLVDLIGPLGNGFTLLEPGKKAVLVGGGIGVPPMVQTAAHYGKNATAIVGFRSANAVILTEDFEKNGNELMLCTDDGTLGRKGFVTQALKERLKRGPADIICACGPGPMLKGVVELARQYGVKCEVSLEERMGCGVGACLVCACKTVKDGQEYYKHVCKDGPIFDSSEVIFDE